jgi:hypothetical protein
MGNDELYLEAGAAHEAALEIEKLGAFVQG